MADVIDEQSFIIPIKKNNLIPDKNYSAKSNLKFLFLSLPYELSPSGKGARCCNTINEALRINGITLPLGRTLLHEYSFSQKERSLSIKNAEKILKTRMALYECFRESESAVRRRKIKLTKTSDSYALNVEYVFNKNIAKKQKLIIK